MRRVVFLAWIVIAAAALGCRSVRRGEPVGRVPEMSSVTVAHGRTLYQQNCFRCHPGGEGGLGPALNDKPLPVFLMKTQVRAGLGVMPGFSSDRISAEELDDLMQYVVALRKAPIQREAGTR